MSEITTQNSEVTTQNNWRELYREALLESEPVLVPSRIEAAHRAIHGRILELWYAGSPRLDEQRDLDTALHFLALLRMVGAGETESSRYRDTVNDTMTNRNLMTGNVIFSR
jgi:hypothetical protein